MRPQNHYELLQVSPEAGPDELRRAWKRAVLRWHPDATHDPRSAGRFRQAQAAWQVLKNEETRRRYDEELRKENPHVFKKRPVRAKSEPKAKSESESLFRNLVFRFRYRVARFPESAEERRVRVDRVLRKLPSSDLMERARLTNNPWVRETAVRALRRRGDFDALLRLAEDSALVSGSGEAAALAVRQLAGFPVRRVWDRLLHLASPGYPPPVKIEVGRMVSSLDRSFARWLLERQVDQRQLAARQGAAALLAAL